MKADLPSQRRHANTKPELWGIMPAAFERALRYRDRAAECKAMADMAHSREFREHYRAIAQYYRTLAEAEETLAEKFEHKQSEQP